MNADLQTAGFLLLVGMSTVLIVITLVVFFGNLLIKVVNKFYKEPAPVIQSVTGQNNASPDTHLAIIAAVVHQHSRGTAEVAEIQNTN